MFFCIYIKHFVRSVCFFYAGIPSASDVLKDESLLISKRCNWHLSDLSVIALSVLGSWFDCFWKCWTPGGLYSLLSGYKNIDDCSLQLESVPESETFSSASGLIPCNQELKSEANKNKKQKKKNKPSLFDE